MAALLLRCVLLIVFSTASMAAAGESRDENDRGVRAPFYTAVRGKRNRVAPIEVEGEEHVHDSASVLTALLAQRKSAISSEQSESGVLRRLRAASTETRARAAPERFFVATEGTHYAVVAQRDWGRGLWAIDLSEGDLIKYSTWDRDLDHVEPLLDQPPTAATVKTSRAP